MEYTLGALSALAVAVGVGLVALGETAAVGALLVAGGFYALVLPRLLSPTALAGQ